MEDCIQLMMLPQEEGGGGKSKKEAIKIAVEMQKKQNERK